MNKHKIWLVLIVSVLCVWTYKIYNTTQAYHTAIANIENHDEIEAALGNYRVTYDWWFGVFRALRYGKIQEFEFHLSGDKDDAVSVVEVVKDGTIWEVSCINVVNGKYLNNRIIQDC
ncbi:hypothetical protein [Aliiglaciecola litoralis]|uniref:Uncharacterized protein n=1 Tax=Aliiglaciecola litoralis TaxID=582857 RepID=A0ABN1LI55_9ALTE